MDEEYTIDISNMTSVGTITVSASEGDIYYNTNNNTYNVLTSTGDWDLIDISSISIKEPVEFEDCMPDIAKVEDMCNDYPGLRKAYENFKAVYKMVHQDWRGRQEDESPF